MPAPLITLWGFMAPLCDVAPVQGELVMPNGDHDNQWGVHVIGDDVHPMPCDHHKPDRDPQPSGIRWPDRPSHPRPDQPDRHDPTRDPSPPPGTFWDRHRPGWGDRHDPTRPPGVRGDHFDRSDPFARSGGGGAATLNSGRASPHLTTGEQAASAAGAVVAFVGGAAAMLGFFGLQSAAFAGGLSTLGLAAGIPAAVAGMAVVLFLNLRARQREDHPTDLVVVPAPAGSRTAEAARLAKASVRNDREALDYLRDASTAGFLTFNGNAKETLEGLRAGGHGGLTPSGDEPTIKALGILVPIARASMQAWADAGKPDEPPLPIEVNSIIRAGAGKHTSGAAVDLHVGSMSGPDIARVLRSLPAGDWGVGFDHRKPDVLFDEADELAHRKESAMKAAVDGVPVPAVVRGLADRSGGVWESRWDPPTKSWVDNPEREWTHESLIRSKEVRDALTALRATGVRINVFYDKGDPGNRRTHLHVQDNRR